VTFYRGADKSLARPTSQCIIFDSENISFDASLVIYINSTNVPPIMIFWLLFVFYLIGCKIGFVVPYVCAQFYK
jgi:hypothetical protein